MRLLLDEMYPAAVAEELRDRGHDVVAVQERRELVGSPDPDVIGTARAERRVLVTEDTRILRAIDDAERHHGILFTSSRSLPHDIDRPGRLIGALDAHLEQHPGDDDLVGRTEWLLASEE